MPSTRLYALTRDAVTGLVGLAAYRLEPAEPGSVGSGGVSRFSTVLPQYPESEVRVSIEDLAAPGCPGATARSSPVHTKRSNVMAGLSQGGETEAGGMRPRMNVANF
jgi:hypothetical protein